MLYTLGGYSIKDMPTKLIYEVGKLKGYSKIDYNFKPTIDGNYLIQASASVIMKPKKTSDGVTIIIKVNDKIIRDKEIKTGSLDYSNYDCDINIALPLRRQDKIEIFCKSSEEGYLNTKEGKSILSITRLIE